jgi:hypothetical protein
MVTQLLDRGTPESRHIDAHSSYLGRFLKIIEVDRLTGIAGSLRSRLMAERLATKTAEGTLGQATDEPQDKALEEMNVRGGDEVVHVHIPAQPAPSQPTPPASPPASQPGSPKGGGHGWLPLALAALGGGALAAGTPYAIDVLRSDGNRPVDERPDKDTRYDIDFGGGDNADD